MKGCFRTSNRDDALVTVDEREVQAATRAKLTAANDQFIGERDPAKKSRVWRRI